MICEFQGIKITDIETDEHKMKVVPGVSERRRGHEVAERTRIHVN